MSDEKKNEKTKSSSIKQKFLIFSVILFLVILIGGSITFTLLMSRIVASNKSNELDRIIQIERMSLESSVNAEIAIAMKMADSPLIKRYFSNPDDADLEAIAFEEIAGYRRAFKGNSVFWVNDIDHKFYSDDAPPFVIDIKDPNNYWYLMTLNETPRYNFNINYNPDLNVTNLWINAPVFDNNRKPIGMLGTGIDLSAFIDSIYKGFKDEADLYFFNDTGEITGAKNQNLVTDKASIENVIGAVGTKVLNIVKENPPAAVLTFSDTSGEVALGPVPTLGWYAVALHHLTIKDYLNTGITVLFLIMLAVILIIIFIFNFSINTFLKPLGAIVSALHQISTDWDLTKRLEINRNDELGTVGDFFNQTFEKFRELLKGIKEQTRSLSDTGDDLAANMTETAAAINEITANVQSMKNQVLAQSDEVSSTSSAMDRIIGGLDKLNENITTQAENVAQSSSAIEEMLANIRAVTETLIKNTGNIASLGESSRIGQEDLQKVSADIQEIAKESEGLLEINSVMQNISSQTNLLSMNAAIEAAHAGESGKGFAVVADEIRKLAENSSQQSKTISTVLKKIKTSIDTITKSTGIVLERFETITNDVEIVSSQESHIRTAMEEQEVGSRQILEAVSRLNAVTGLVKSASADMTSDSRNIISQSSSLKQITETVAGGMDEMAIGADQINEAVNKVNEISSANKENIGVLSREIEKFKVN